MHAVRVVFVSTRVIVQPSAGSETIQLASIPTREPAAITTFTPEPVTDSPMIRAAAPMPEGQLPCGDGFVGGGGRGIGAGPASSGSGSATSTMNTCASGGGAVFDTGGSAGGGEHSGDRRTPLAVLFGAFGESEADGRAYLGTEHSELFDGLVRAGSEQFVGAIGAEHDQR